MVSDKKKILLVEDEPEFRQGVRMRLEANGYEVIEAEDGAVGLETARNQSPDLVILDLMLPKMEGYQVARLLKFDEKHRKIPIIMLTARSQQDDKDTGLAVGANAYMTKPFKADELLETISRLLSESE
ncbi:response regulator transcription factor [Verrucomicrobiota bacterium]